MKGVTEQIMDYLWKNNMNIHGLSKMTGIQHPNIYRWMQGHNSPSADKIKILIEHKVIKKGTK